MNEKWFALSLDEIEKKLKTNAAQGLTRRAARSRYSKTGGSLFSFEKRSYISLFGEVISDFSLVVLLILSLSAIFFEEYLTGIITSLFSLACLALATVIYHRSERFSENTERAFAPSCKVIRQGKLYEIRGDHLVVGDVILIDEGDILCCDARLITSEELLVKMRLDKDNYTVLDKLAEGHVGGGEYDVRKHVNMVHAGSVVLRGAARAVVTATAGFTYIGAKVGPIFSVSERTKKTPSTLQTVKKYTSKASLALLLASLPISFVSILLGGENLSLFSAFMTCLALSVSCMAHFSTSLFKIFFAVPMRRCISSRHSVCVRNFDAFDRFGASKYLFLLDGGALTDGIAHFDSAYSADAQFERSDTTASPSVKKLAELASLYESAQSMGLSTSRSSRARYAEGIRDLIKAAGCDRDALKIRCSVKGVVSGNSEEPYDKVFFTDLGEEYMICVSEDEKLIYECSNMICDGRRTVIDADSRESILKKYRCCLALGKTPIIFALSRHKGYGRAEELCFSGIVAFSELFDKNAFQALNELQSRNVKAIFFKNITVNGSKISVSPIPNEITRQNVADASDFIKSNKPISYGFGKINCYASLSDLQVCELIAFLRKKGESVTVVGSSEKFERIYRAADVVVSALPDTMLAERVFEESEDMQENDTSSLSISQTLKYRSDVAIQRPISQKGGVWVLSHLLAEVGIAYANISLFLKYLISVQTLRIAFVLFPMLLGNATLDARHIIFGGAILDMIALLSFAFDKNGRMSSQRANEILRDPFSNSIGLICGFAGCAAFALLLPELISLFPGVSVYADRTEYSFICLTLLNISLFLSIRLSGTKELFFARRNRGAFISSAAVATLLGLIYIIPYFSAWFGIEGFSAPVYLVAAFIPPIISFAVGVIFGEKKLRTKG